MHECSVCKRTSEECQVSYCSIYGDYLCSKHKNQIRRHNRITDYDDPVCCDICHKTKQDNVNVTWCSKAGMYLCGKHRSQIDRCSQILERTKRDPNEIEIKDSFAIMRFDNSDLVAYIDIEDVEKCQKHKWFTTEKKGNTNYVRTQIDGRKVSLHRFVMNCEDDNMFIDHINRDGLDNRKSNLRIVTPSENSVNSKTRSTTGEKNIYYKDNKYQVQIKRNHKQVFCKTFMDIRSAIEARDDFIKKYNLENNRQV